MNERKSKVRIVLLVLGAIMLAAVIGGYISAAFYYQKHFLPNTWINNIDCNGLEPLDVTALLEKEISDYSIEIEGRNETGKREVLGTIQASDIDLTALGILTEVEHLLDRQNSWLWIKSYLTEDTTNYSMVPGVEFDKKKLQDLLGSISAFQEKNMIRPKDAYITDYLEEAKGYEIVPEVIGTRLDMEAVTMVIESAIYSNSQEVDLEGENCYQQVGITAENEQLKEELTTLNKWIGAEVIYNWNGNRVVVGADLLKEWITLEEGGPVLDEEAVAGFVKENAKKYDTYGRDRKFRTTAGEERTLPSGGFGWRTDCEGEMKALIQAIRAGEKTEKEPLYLSKGAVKGINDIGSSYVEADLTNQHLYLYKNEAVVLETDFVSGDMDGAIDCITPQGVFGITYKTTNAILRGGDYETPVAYWMPFCGNYGMHDAAWRTEFGGEIYLTDGSHGCINLPPDMAAAIYEQVYTGFPVICYY